MCRCPAAEAAEVLARQLPHQTISRTVSAWQASEDRGRLAAFPPAWAQAGKHGSGVVTTEQKLDLVRWIRMRESLNVPVRRSDLTTALAKYWMLNAVGLQADESMENLESSCKFQQFCRQHQMRHVYDDFFKWARANVGPDVQPSRGRARGLRSVEAAVVTPSSVSEEFAVLGRLLQKHGIATAEGDVVRPDRSFLIFLNE